VEWEGLDGSQGAIRAEHVVNCGGMWGRELAAQSGVALPLHAAEHFYVVSEPIPGLERLPVLRVPDECAYYKEDAGKIMIGAFEPVAKPWGMGGIPETFEFDELPFDMEHMEPVLEKAIARVPLLARAGFRTLFNGPESFTPDNRYYLGEVPELRGYWIAAGYNSIGIVSSGGAGMALAQWMEDGEPPFDLWEVDIRRAQPFQRNRTYLRERVSETLGLLYADHYPYRQVVTARGVRKSPVHDRLAARGAVFGEVAGWERANWFAKPGEAREYRYAWSKQNWWANQREEHLAVRERVGLFDMTSFGKIRVEGRDACAVLQRLCGNDVDVPVGRIVYTQMLNRRGGIEADVTVTRLSETAFLVVTAGAHLRRDMAWIRRHVGDAFAVVTDASAAESCFVVMGPEARDLLRAVTPDDLSNAAFPYGTAREIELGLGLARAHRVSYVGELGWELYVPTDQAQHAFDVLVEAGGERLKLCGLHALDSLRMEKAYRHWGHDITDEDHVLEAGLGFAVKADKGEFLGRDAVVAKHNEGLARRLVQFRLSDPEPILVHNEGIVRDGEIVGILTSGAFGHHLGGAVGLGYVPCQGESPAELLASRFEIEIAGTRVAAEASLRPMYDPRAERVRM
jgi:4-methylaminobutanoate oxidase (formaldehyde-forming)